MNYFAWNLLQEPFNAEPPRAALISSYITSVDYFYKRNHGPIPIVDDIERFHLFLLIVQVFYKLKLNWPAWSLHTAVVWWELFKLNRFLLGQSRIFKLEFLLFTAANSFLLAKHLLFSSRSREAVPKAKQALTPGDLWTELLLLIGMTDIVLQYVVWSKSLYNFLWLKSGNAWYDYLGYNLCCIYH